jgi:hypothetical protein
MKILTFSGLLLLFIDISFAKELLNELSGRCPSGALTLVASKGQRKTYSCRSNTGKESVPGYEFVVLERRSGDLLLSQRMPNLPLKNYTYDRAGRLISVETAMVMKKCRYRYNEEGIREGAPSNPDSCSEPEETETQSRSYSPSREIQGCPGGEVSPDGRTISCADGTVYRLDNSQGQMTRYFYSRETDTAPASRDLERGDVQQR